MCFIVTAISDELTQFHPKKITAFAAVIFLSSRNSVWIYDRRAHLAHALSFILFVFFTLNLKPEHLKAFVVNS